MAKSPAIHCSFCGRNRDEVKILIAGQDGHICENCIEHAHEIIVKEFHQKKAEGKAGTLKVQKPMAIKAFMDQYIIGQDEAKKILCVAVYNHFKRVAQKPQADDVEIEKQFGPFEIAIGHSLGGMSVLNAIKDGLIVDKAVIIGSGDIVQDILDEFGITLNNK